jgi:hypothetical protein
MTYRDIESLISARRLFTKSLGGIEREVWRAGRTQIGSNGEFLIPVKLADGCRTAITQDSIVADTLNSFWVIREAA